MKYCPACKKLHGEKEVRCKNCGKRLKTIVDINEPVTLSIVGGPERAMLTALLKDNDIPFVEQNVMPQGVSNEIVTGYDVKLSNINVTVPYSAIPKAYDLAKGIETGDKDIETLIDDVEKDIELAKKERKEAEEMNPKKRTLIRIITAILFFVLIAIAVFGTDYIMNLIKGLFGG